MAGEPETDKRRFRIEVSEILNTSEPEPDKPMRTQWTQAVYVQVVEAVDLEAIVRAVNGISQRKK